MQKADLSRVTALETWKSQITTQVNGIVNNGPVCVVSGYATYDNASQTKTKTINVGKTIKAYFIATENYQGEAAGKNAIFGMANNNYQVRIRSTALTGRGDIEMVFNSDYYIPMFTVSGSNLIYDTTASYFDGTYVNTILYICICAA